MMKLLTDLYSRLVEDYNNGIKFEQMEEDRLALRNVIDLLSSYTCSYVENKLEKKLVWHRFNSVVQIMKTIENTLLLNHNCKVNGIEESWKNEDEDYEYNDYELISSLEIDGMEYYLTIYYLKTRNGEMYITEICLEEE